MKLFYSALDNLPLKPHPASYDEKIIELVLDICSWFQLWCWT